MDTYPWASRVALADRLTTARLLLADVMHQEPLSLRQFLTLFPELRPTAEARKSRRWTRSDAVREYAHVTAAQRADWTTHLNALLGRADGAPTVDDLRATLLPVMAYVQMGGNQ